MFWVTRVSSAGVPLEVDERVMAGVGLRGPVLAVAVGSARTSPAPRDRSRSSGGSPPSRPPGSSSTHPAGHGSQGSPTRWRSRRRSARRGARRRGPTRRSSPRRPARRPFWPRGLPARRRHAVVAAPVTWSRTQRAACALTAGWNPVAPTTASISARIDALLDEGEREPSRAFPGVRLAWVGERSLEPAGVGFLRRGGEPAQQPGRQPREDPPHGRRVRAVVRAGEVELLEPGQRPADRGVGTVATTDAQRPRGVGDAQVEPVGRSVEPTGEVSQQEESRRPERRQPERLGVERSRVVARRVDDGIGPRDDGEGRRHRSSWRGRHTPGDPAAARSVTGASGDRARGAGRAARPRRRPAPARPKR